MPSDRSFFTVGRRAGRHWFVSPAGQPEFSLGLNHFDPATLRCPDSGPVWRARYGNSMRKWLGQVRADLAGWGFNCMGWNQEVVINNAQSHRHSRSFTYEEYQWLDYPYAHMLPFIESHQWEVETRLPDVCSPEFAEWCDYVARDECARFADDPKLIGYFYTDCPMWVHQARDAEWKAPLFDPARLGSEAGRRALFDMATTYYRVIHEAIRRYDSNHLILGDRYEANAPLPDLILKAAAPYVDVFGFQCFGASENVIRKMTDFAKRTGKPILVADSAHHCAHHDPHWPARKDREHDGEEYRRTLMGLRRIPECIGYHLCGAYLRNGVRRSGLRDRCGDETVSAAAVRAVNHDMQAWIRDAAGA